MKRSLLGLAVFLTLATAQSQTKRVLFLGNSYTYVNNLPQMVAYMASSAGDTLLIESNAMGSATFYVHSINPVSINKIMSGNWDYVILQGQSLELWGDFPDIRATCPQVIELDSLIHQYSPCAETVFFRTWGRKNGFPPYSFQTMDSMIHVSYMKLADSLDAVLSPVGEVWKYIRQQNPSIELYDADESHPSVAGTYAAACSFYATLLRKSPASITFNPGLPASDAAAIRNAAKSVVHDSLLKWHIGEYDSLLNVICHPTALSQSTYNNSSIEVFPNPFSLQATLSTKVPFYNATLTLDNSFGQTVKQVKNISGLAVTLDRGNLPGGLYFLHLTEGNKKFTCKLVIADN